MFVRSTPIVSRHVNNNWVRKWWNSQSQQHQAVTNNATVDDLPRYCIYCGLSINVFVHRVWSCLYVMNESLSRHRHSPVDNITIPLLTHNGALTAHASDTSVTRVWVWVCMWLVLLWQCVQVIALHRKLLSTAGACTICAMHSTSMDADKCIYR